MPIRMMYPSKSSPASRRWIMLTTAQVPSPTATADVSPRDHRRGAFRPPAATQIQLSALKARKHAATVSHIGMRVASYFGSTVERTQNTHSATHAVATAARTSSAPRVSISPSRDGCGASLHEPAFPDVTCCDMIDLLVVAGALPGARCPGVLGRGQAQQR